MNEKDAKFLEQASKRLSECIDAESHNRELAVDDDRMLYGDQWDDRSCSSAG